MKVTTLKPNQIFVFGSNLAGRHGKGAALYARQHFGAIYGQGVGRQGQCYAIPTKDSRIKTLPLTVIKVYVDEFLDYAEQHKDLEFLLTPIGTGLAGYSLNDLYNILPYPLPSNVIKLF